MVRRQLHPGGRIRSSPSYPSSGGASSIDGGERVEFCVWWISWDPVRLAQPISPLFLPRPVLASSSSPPRKRRKQIPSPNSQETKFNPSSTAASSGSAEMPPASSAVEWLQAAAQDAANSSSSSSSSSGTSAFPDQVLVSRAAGLLEQSPVMSAEDESVLKAIRSAVRAAGKNCGGIRDPADPTVMALVLKKMTHISTEGLSRRIRAFQKMVDDHVQNKVPITENKEILLEVFASASSKKRAFAGEGGNSHAKRSCGSDSADNRSAGWMEKRANAELCLHESQAARRVVSSPLNMGDVTDKLQQLGFKGSDLMQAIDMFMDPSNVQTLEIRHVFLTMKEDDDARRYVLHKLGENQR